MISILEFIFIATSHNHCAFTINEYITIKLAILRSEPEKTSFWSLQSKRERQTVSKARVNKVSIYNIYFICILRPWSSRNRGVLFVLERLTGYSLRLERAKERQRRELMSGAPSNFSVKLTVSIRVLQCYLVIHL